MELRDADLLRSDAYIDGTWVEADSGERFPVVDPATGEELARVPLMTATESRRSVEGAAKALPGWRARTSAERYGILRSWAQLLRDHKADLAMIMTREQGKPLAESEGEIVYSAAFIDWFAEEGRRVYGETIPVSPADRRLLVLKEPVGVGVAITPWNFPTAMAARKAGAALAAGCTIVVKPAEQTPLSALAMAELADRAGLPPGVLNVITTDEVKVTEVGGELTANPAVRHVSFTGSTEVGRLLMQQCAATVKRISLELGGSAPFIVFDDADLDAAVAGLLFAKFRNSGQVCIAANRVLVQDGVYDDFLERLVIATSGVRVGAGTEPDVLVGPLIDEQGLIKVQRHVDDATAKGATVAHGGAVSERGGNFYEPTVLAGVTPDMLIMREETFGPVAGLVRFSSEQEAVQLANATDYGLAAYFYTRDVGRLWRVSEALEFGVVGANTGLITSETAPFGGMKQSGIGREGSRHGLDEWLEIKSLAIGGI